MDCGGSKRQRENGQDGETIKREANWESPGELWWQSEKEECGRRIGRRVLRGDREERI